MFCFVLSSMGRTSPLESLHLIQAIHIHTIASRALGVRIMNSHIFGLRPTKFGIFLQFLHSANDRQTYRYVVFILLRFHALSPNENRKTRDERYSFSCLAWRKFLASLVSLSLLWLLIFRTTLIFTNVNTLSIFFFNSCFYYSLSLII